MPQVSFERVPDLSADAAPGRAQPQSGGGHVDGRYWDVV